MRPSKIGGETTRYVFEQIEWYIYRISLLLLLLVGEAKVVVPEIRDLVAVVRQDVSQQHEVHIERPGEK